MLSPLPPKITSLSRPGTGTSLQSLLHDCGIFLLRDAGDVKEGSNGGCKAQTKSKHPDFSSNSSWLTVTWREVNVYGLPGLLKGISILTELGARAYPVRPFKRGIRGSMQKGEPFQLSRKRQPPRKAGLVRDQSQGVEGSRLPDRSPDHLPLSSPPPCLWPPSPRPLCLVTPCPAYSPSVICLPCRFPDHSG